MAPRASGADRAHGPVLPKVSFRKWDDDVKPKPQGVEDKQARSYGFNDCKDFERPEHYIRHIEPIQSDLINQVEYDMDEQDKEWLDAINQERLKDQETPVSYESFEIIIDRLEKEWFDLMKRVPKAEVGGPPEDSTCAVCDDGEGENSNAIVFCDGCNLAVHQECYGVPYIPEGQWLCRKCTVSPENPVSCVFCPAEAGAFKQTTNGKWAHLLCAIWIPEVSVRSTGVMEPIEDVERVPKQRWRLTCQLCHIKTGACIQCINRNCYEAFHVTCARKAGFLSPMKSLNGGDVPLQAFCEKHLPPQLAEARPEKHSIESSTSPQPPHTPKSTKTALAHSSHYAPPAPLVPDFIVKRLIDYTTRIRITHRQAFINTLCKYWSLKREARRGAPLLKRLHLEPWTAGSMGKLQTDEQKMRRLEHLRRVRQDIEKIRLLAEYVVKREVKKLRRCEEIQDLVDKSLFPYEPLLQDVFEKVTSLDRMKHFFNPVSRVEVPDYYIVVKKPMDWTEMSEKFRRHEYLAVSEFQADVNLVFDNSMLYNAPNTQFYKQAARMKIQSAPILAMLDALKQKDASLGVDQASEVTRVDVPNGTGSVASPQSAETSRVEEVRSPGTEASVPVIALSPDIRVNDLEPSLELLALLEDTEAIASSVPFLLTGTPLDTMFHFGLSKLKPQRPPPPLKPRRNRVAERARRAEERLKAIAEEKERTRLVVAFDGPRTRRAMKEAAAFEAEAHGGELPTAEGTSFIHDGTEAAPCVEEPPVQSNQDRMDFVEELPAALDASGELHWDNAKALVSGGAIERPIVTESIVDPVPMVGIEDGSGIASSWLAEAEYPDDGIVVDRVETGLAAAPLEKATRKRKRMWEIPAVPPVVDEVDNLQSFKHFETGWVLDGRTRSGNRPHLVDIEQGPPRKKVRSSLPRSKPEQPNGGSRKGRNTLQSSLSSTIQPPPQASPGSSIALSGRIPTSLTVPDGASSDLTSVPPDDIEMNDAHNELTSTSIAEVSIGGRHTTTPFREDSDAVSDANLLADRSNSTSDVRRGPLPARTQALFETLNNTAKKKRRREDVKHNIISDDEAARIFIPGTLVWAKMDTFPWYPAEIYADDDIFNAGPGVLAVKSQKQDEAGRPVFLTRFYDKSESWQWMSPVNLYLLGDNETRDMALLDRRVFRSTHMQQQVRAAYKRAVAEMETPEEVNHSSSIGVPDSAVHAADGEREESVGPVEAVNASGD